MAQGFTNYLEQKILDYVFGGAAFTAPTVYLGLHVGATAPDLENPGVTVVEPSGGAYARKLIANADFATATQNGSGQGQKQNANAIPFATATANWGTATHFVLFDGTSAGANVLAIGVLSTSKLINSGDTASFAQNSLTITLD